MAPWKPGALEIGIKTIVSGNSSSGCSPRKVDASGFAMLANYPAGCLLLGVSKSIFELAR